MAMDPTRLPRNRPPAAAPVTPPVVKTPPAAKPRPKKAKAAPAARPETAADMKGPHLPVSTAPPAAQAPTSRPEGQSVQGLDSLTLELVQAAPLVPVGATAPPSPAQSQGLTPAASGTRPGIKSPTVLVALGGAVAAGLLLIIGFRTSRGHSTAAGRTSAAPLPTPEALSIANLPTPTAWLKAGGS